MDFASVTNQLTSAVTKQLAVDGIASLQVQNHIYGCFVLMEDIAEKSSIENTVFDDFCIKENNYTFHISTQFSEIGIRYGFLMDTKLIFDSFLPEYKNAWLDLFKIIHERKSVEDVDKIEDTVIEVIKTNVLSEMAFFLQALPTGSLPKDWVSKVIILLTTGSLPVAQVENEKVDLLAKANIEKNRKLSKTKRNNVVVKKYLGKTRRHSKV